MTSARADLTRAVKSLEVAAVKRNDAILRLRAAGWSLREIAAVANLTPQGVKLICDTYA